MSVAIVIAALLLFYGLGYRRWSYYLSSKVWGIKDNESVPAHHPILRDDIDYMPVKKHILWGHHYTSIAGAAPIIGPAVAVVWGWVPALVWVVLGTIFIGAVHDFGALVLSARNDGRSVSDVSAEVIHPRVRLLFQIVIYFLIWIVLAVFSFAIGLLFHKYPATVIPINFEILVAVVIGYLFYKKRVPILIPSILALILLYGMVFVGLQWPISFPVVTWALLLLLYAAVASLLPVWSLLQPRDYINSHQLLVGLGALIVGLCILRPEMTAPALNVVPEGAPPIFPFLFITIACGAISGFHGLVSSNTTSKQLNSMSDARAIGYGGMLGEGLLAVVATVAVAAGLKDWEAHYHSWNSSGIHAISNFVQGASSFLKPFGIPNEWALALVAVMVISFAATSMDTAARVQRLLVMEMGQAFNWKLLKNRYVATVFAVAPVVPLVVAGPKVWGALWLLFGTTNQLIGGMTLLVMTVYLMKRKRPYAAILYPMMAVLTVTSLAMIMNLKKWLFQCYQEPTFMMGLTTVIGVLILCLELWVILESVLVFRRGKR